MNRASGTCETISNICVIWVPEERREKWYGKTSKVIIAWNVPNLGKDVNAVSTNSASPKEAEVKEHRTQTLNWLKKKKKIKKKSSAEGEMIHDV